MGGLELNKTIVLCETLFYDYSMCGRYAYFAELKQIIKRYSIDNVIDEPQSNYNIAPTDPVSIIVNHDDKRECRTVRWGLLPNWIKDVKSFKGRPLINARSETIDSNGLFRDSFKNRRCIVIASGYYEWKKNKTGKQAYFIHLNNRTISFAGIYDFWKDPIENKLIPSCSILTTTANQSSSQIHPRIPVILQSKQWEDIWLNNKDYSSELLRQTFLSEEYQALNYYPVSNEVGNVKSGGKQLINKI